MRVEVEDVTPIKKTMSVEVDARAAADYEKQVLQGFAQGMKLPGFRKGKAPADVVRSRLTAEARGEVLEQLVAHFYRKATREQGLTPVADARLEGEVKFAAGEPLQFKTTFEVRPQIELKGHRGVEARRKSAKIEDSDVDQALEELRQSRATLVSDEGAASATGHILLADVTGQSDAEEDQPFSHEKTLIEVGGPDHLPAFTDGIMGARSGDTREFDVDYPKEYPSLGLAGKTVHYRIVVHDVKRREVPELDDEFAKDLGAFDDLAALRERLREDLLARRQSEAEREVRNAVLDKVLVENPILLPEGLVEAEIKSRLEELARRMVVQGVDPSKAEIDWKEVWKQQEEPARKAVHARLILDAVAEFESIEVSDAEVDERIRLDARRLKETPEKLRRELEKHGGVEALKIQLVREKSLDLLTHVANIQNED